MSIAFIPSPENPTRLSPRYEIRQLTRKHCAWATAIVAHSGTFHSPIWALTYPEDQVKRLHRRMDAASYLISHQIDSGMSFGIFDLEYEFKRPESEATQGKLYWDPKALDVDSATLLQQMDFPLCSVAMAYDGTHELERTKMQPLLDVVPLFGTVYAQLEAADTRAPATRKPRAPGEILRRNGTATRADYAGQGLMRQLAHFLMRQVALSGFGTVQMESASDSVTRVWMHPPEPFASELVATFDTGAYTEETEDGTVVHPFGASKQVTVRMIITLVSPVSTLCKK